MPKCAICKKDFKRTRPLQRVCSMNCAIEHARQKQEKAFKKEARQLKKKIKTKTDWLKETQVVFNRYIRLRDRRLPCISCGRFHAGQWHAGHYRTVKAAPQLRFDEANCHKQCQPCNTHLSGNIVKYRANLITKIGIDEVERIESDNSIMKRTIEEIIIIKEKYTKLVRNMEKE